MTTEDFIDMARVIIQAVHGGADEYDIAKQLNKLYGAGQKEGVKSLGEALRETK